MQLNELIEFIKPLNTIDLANIEIKGMSYNSKLTQEGDVFVCLVGEHVDGHNYAKQAQEKGAVAIVAQKELDNFNIPVLVVKDTQYELSRIASLLYDFPSKKLNLIGVTGTNGKTTVTHLLERIFEEAGFTCGLIGTLGQRISSKSEYFDAKHTTPQAPELQAVLNKMHEHGARNVVMEVSSHALEQHRVGGCEFAGAVLTNLTQDHLDYHITMENYFQAKSKLFASLKPSGQKEVYAVINLDDPSAQRFIDSVSQGIKVYTYGVKNKADIVAENIDFSMSGSTFECKTPFGHKKVSLQMTGMFSVYNALAALSAGLAEGVGLDVCIRALESTKGVAGRFEAVAKEPLAIVDYAHTPDGLENVLKAAREIVSKEGKLVCVFGCGGDRDATKRPKMAQIAEELADRVIITSDNPRTEDPQQIITDVLTGIKSLNPEKIFVEIDRRSAIEYAIKNADETDVIVVAGKGHEDYQILKDKTIHFDDREEVRRAFELFRK